jgi:hypothetical protein
MIFFLQIYKYDRIIARQICFCRGIKTSQFLFEDLIVAIKFFFLLENYLIQYIAVNFMLH